jgi:hypothetical protein
MSGFHAVYGKLANKVWKFKAKTGTKKEKTRCQGSEGTLGECGMAFPGGTSAPLGLRKRPISRYFEGPAVAGPDKKSQVFRRATRHHSIHHA